jgi:alkaline phosphatase D
MEAGEIRSDERLFNRRAFVTRTTLAASAAVMFGTGALASGQARARPRFRDDPFRLGVASGEPAPDGVALWTRLAPDPLAPDGRGGMPDVPVHVRFEVAADEHFRHVVRRGAAEARPELAHSVHPEVGGLRSDREYFYRFKAGNEISPVGRTRTAPHEWARPG